MFTKPQSESKWFYEKTKSLHERYQKCEAMAVEYEEKIYAKEDGYKLSTEMYKPKDLQGYWYKVVADGERSKTRNMKILEKIAALDQLMHSLGSKTNRLDSLREEYVNITMKLQSLGNEHPLWDTQPNTNQMQNQNVSKSHVSQRWLESVTESGIGSSCTPSRSLQHGWTQTDKVCCPHCSNYIFDETYDTTTVVSKTNHVYQSKAITHLESIFSDQITEAKPFQTASNLSHALGMTRSFSVSEPKLEGEGSISYFTIDSKDENIPHLSTSAKHFRGSVIDTPISKGIWEGSQQQHEKESVKLSGIKSSSYDKEGNCDYQNENQYLSERTNQYPSTLVTQGPVPDNSVTLTNIDNLEVENFSSCYDTNCANQIQNPLSILSNEQEQRMEYDDNLNCHKQTTGFSSYASRSDNNCSGSNQDELQSQQNECIIENYVKPVMLEHQEVSANMCSNNNISSLEKQQHILNTVNLNEHSTFSEYSSPAQPIRQDAISVSPDSSISYHQQLDLENRVFETLEKRPEPITQITCEPSHIRDHANAEILDKTSHINLLKKGNILSSSEKELYQTLSTSTSELLATKSFVSDNQISAANNQERQSISSELPSAALMLSNSGKGHQLKLDHETSSFDGNFNNTLLKTSEQEKMKKSNEDSSEDSTCMDDVEDNFFDNDPPMMKECNAYRALLGIQAHHKESDSEDDIENKFVQTVMFKDAGNPDSATGGAVGNLDASSQKLKIIPSIVTSQVMGSNSESSIQNQEISSPKKTEPIQKKSITTQERNRIKKKVLLLGQGFDSDLEDSVKSLEKEPCDVDDDFFD